MTPEQLAAYFNAEWFQQQLYACLQAQEWQELGYPVPMPGNRIQRVFAALAAHLAGNLAQAAMALEGEE